MSDLVQRLSAGQHPLEVSLRPSKSVSAFKERLDSGYVHLRFTGTRGGTELGMRVSAEQWDGSKADFENGTGQVALTGELTLDYVPVRCVATIALDTLQGEGHLEPIG